MNSRSARLLLLPRLCQTLTQVLLLGDLPAFCGQGFRGQGLPRLESVLGLVFRRREVVVSQMAFGEDLEFLSALEADDGVLIDEYICTILDIISVGPKYPETIETKFAHIF